MTYMKAFARLIGIKQTKSKLSSPVTHLPAYLLQNNTSHTNHTKYHTLRSKSTDADQVKSRPDPDSFNVIDSRADSGSLSVFSISTRSMNERKKKTHQSNQSPQKKSEAVTSPRLIRFITKNKLARPLNYPLHTKAFSKQASYPIQSNPTPQTTGEKLPITKPPNPFHPRKNLLPAQPSPKTRSTPPETENSVSHHQQHLHNRYTHSVCTCDLRKKRKKERNPPPLCKRTDGRTDGGMHKNIWCVE